MFILKSLLFFRMLLSIGIISFYMSFCACQGYIQLNKWSTINNISCYSENNNVCYISKDTRIGIIGGSILFTSINNTRNNSNFKNQVEIQNTLTYNLLDYNNKIFSFFFEGMTSNNRIQSTSQKLDNGVIYNCLLNDGCCLGNPCRTSFGTSIEYKDNILTIIYYTNNIVKNILRMNYIISKNNNYAVDIVGNGTFYIDYKYEQFLSYPA